MSSDYASYTDVILNAFLVNPKGQDAVTKKQELLDSISRNSNSVPSSILFVGFAPWILSARNKQVYVTEVSEQVKKYLDSLGVKYTYIDSEDLGNHGKQFNWVVAAHEYFTFASSEEEQRTKILKLATVAKDMIITTLKDYKNQDLKDKEFSVPLAVRSDKNVSIYLEYNNYDFREKNTWTSKVYEIQEDKLTTHGSYNRCVMYFKQMAKFSMDAGAADFSVHKNIMYKSLIKKNYEHVISILFKKNYGNQ